MKKSLLVSLKSSLFLLLFLLTTAVQAQENSLLWKISGKGLRTPSYLFGTIHIICEEDAMMTGAMRSAFIATEKLVLELDMSDQSQMISAAKLIMVPEGIDYKGKLSEQAYNRLDELMKESMGMGMQIGRMMKPFGLMAVAYQSLVACDNTTAMEEEFMTMMEGTDKTIEGLETVAFQLSIFDNIPMDEQISWLDEMMKDSDEAQAEFSKMMSAYKAQDVEALFNLFRESPEYLEYEDALLTDRNKAWIPKMAEIMEAQPTFFAVGAGHLGGENGVIQLLKNEGYTVEAVENR